MLQVFGLILIAVLHAGSANTIDELKKKIAVTKNETLETLKEVAIVKAKISTVERKIFKYKEAHHSLMSKLSHQEKEIISNLYKLGATASITESSIQSFEKGLLIEKQNGYRLKFITRLLDEDLGFLQSRRKNGEERACFAFAMNKTVMEKSLVREREFDIASNLEPEKREVLELEAELRKVQWELEDAQRQLALAKEELQARTQQLATTESTGSAEMRDLIKNILKADETLRKFENDIKRLTDKLNKLKVELKKEKSHNLEQNRKNLKLRSELGKFKSAIECYNHLENKF